MLERQPPKLSVPEVDLLNASYHELVVASACGCPDDPMLEKLIRETSYVSTDGHDDSLVLGAKVAKDIFQLLDNYPEDLTNLGREFIDKTNTTVDILRKGNEINRWMQESRQLPQKTPSEPFCPEITAAYGALATRSIAQLQSERSFRRFLRIIAVPPAFLSYSANKR